MYKWPTRHHVENHQQGFNTRTYLTKMPPKRKITEPEVIHHLDEIVELRVLKVIQDGEGKRANVYLIECRRHLEQSTTAPAEQSSICVLKTVSP